MSVYRRGDRDSKEEKKGGDDLLAEAGKAIEGVGKSISTFFSSKEKKWEKKGGGHKLGSASDAPPPPPPPPQQKQHAVRPSLPPPPRAMTPAAEAAAAREAALARQRAGSSRPVSAAMRAVSASERAPAQQRIACAGNTGTASASGASTPPRPAPVDEASVAICVEMGFDAASAREALAAKSGNVEAAIDLLASGFMVKAPPPTQQSSLNNDMHPPSPAKPPQAVPSPPFVRVAVPQDAAARLAAAHEAAAALAADGAATLPTLTLLKKLLSNVLSSPEDAKYRRVRLTNPKIASTIGSRAAAHALLQLCGFELADAGSEISVDVPAEAVEMRDAYAHDRASLEECVALVSQAEEWATQAEAGPSDVRVLYAPDGCGAARVQDMGEDFYRLTADDAKAMVAAAAARREREGVLQTRAQREAEAAKRRRRYRKASIRVRFMDGTMLQATFAVSSPVSRIIDWVSESLREPGHAFELSVPRGKPLTDRTTSIEAAELAPAALLNFRLAPGEVMEPPFLTQWLLDTIQPLDAQVAAVPEGEGGMQLPEGGAGQARTMSGEPRVPKWAPK